MAKISDVDVTSLLFQEGSAPATPAATKWRAYFKTSGLFYKDDAGTETGPLAAAASLPSGTSFPGGPANNDLYYRTDLDLLFFYDGTRWLTTTLYTDIIGASGVTKPISATGFPDQVATPLAGSTAMWLENVWLSFIVVGGTALSASHKWVVTFNSQPAATLLATVTIDSGSLSVWRNSGPVAYGASVPTTEFLISVTATKTGTPGTLNTSPRMSYRLIGT
jgi:hypothetical protein